MSVSLLDTDILILDENRVSRQQAQFPSDEREDIEFTTAQTPVLLSRQEWNAYWFSTHHSISLQRLTRVKLSRRAARAARNLLRFDHRKVLQRVPGFGS